MVSRTQQVLCLDSCDVTERQQVLCLIEFRHSCCWDWIFLLSPILERCLHSTTRITLSDPDLNGRKLKTNADFLATLFVIRCQSQIFTVYAKIWLVNRLSEMKGYTQFLVCQSWFLLCS